MIERLTGSRQPDQTVAFDPAQKKKLDDAAQQFESLLITQLLRSARGDSEGGWLGTGGDASGMRAAEYAEEMFARALSAGGGLGLGRSITAAIEASPTPSEVNR